RLFHRPCAPRMRISQTIGIISRETPPRSFFGNLPRLYSFRRRKPAMAINGRCNKPIGRGGSTRRLHQRGRNRIDEGVKSALLPGMGPTLWALNIVANDNYAPVAQAA